MRKPRGLTSAALGLGGGLLLGLLLLQHQQQQRQREPEVQARQEAAQAQQQQQHPPREALLVDKSSTRHGELQSNDEKGGLLFVGVMTARKYLETRARAVHESWGREVPGKLGFYSSEGSRASGLSVLGLPRVDDSYPPQKKSFLMLQHMWQRYGEQYEWFLRADDDLYVRMDRLEKLLRSVDSRRPAYIGQAGRGNSEEFGLLSLEYDENFCMGGPGVILSRETLRRIVPHIKHCLANLYTGHEDVELGRCVRKFAGISCTWSYEMQSILYHNSSGDLAFTGRLKNKEVHQAISMHPVKSPPHMYRLHNYMRGLKIQELQQRRIELQRDVERMLQSLAVATATGASKLEGRSAAAWDFVSRSEYRLGDENPRRRLHGDLREGLEDVTREVMASINACSRQRGRFVEERQALYGYRRRTARGVDTVLDLLLLYRKYRGRKVTLPVRRHLYLHQSFTGLETREVSTDELDEQLIHLVVPVSGRRQALLRFLRNLEHVCLRPGSLGGPVQLLLVLFPEESLRAEPNDEAHRLLKQLRRNYGETKIRLVQGQGRFSRARALDQAAGLLRDQDLMLFLDVDIGFAAPALQRVRRNTLRARRLYFPVVFSQYDPGLVGAADPNPEAARDQVNPYRGFWRLFGFGIAALYKSDYEAIGGFDLGIEGWGKEDVDLFEKAVRSNLEIFRASDVDLVHVYHGVSCASSLGGHQLAMCKGTRADTYASTEQLASLIYRNPDYLRFARLKKAANNSSPAA